jgi:outer membrane protein assembly factor BamE (lipoprotein component of BamABCDE complex)
LLRIVLKLTAGLALVTALIVGIGVYRARSFASNFRAVRIGDTREEVLRLLGSPNWQFPKGNQLWDTIRKQNLILRLLTPDAESPETWVYGHWRPVWLAPSEGDYVVEFDDAGTVSRFYRNPRHRQ